MNIYKEIENLILKYKEETGEDISQINVYYEIIDGKLCVVYHTK